MAQVPYSPLTSVQPAGAPIPSQNIQASPEAFGSGVGRALQSAGSEIKSGGDELGGALTHQQDIYNAANANDLDIKAMTEIGEITNKYRALEGKNAVDAQTQYSADIAALRDKYRGQAANPAVGRMLDQMLTRRIGTAIQDGATYASQQNKAYFDSQGQAKVALGIQQAGQQQEDGRFAEITSGVVDDAKHFAENQKGWSPEQQQLYVQGEKDKAFTSYVQGHAITDPVRMGKFLEENKANLSPQAYDTLAKSVRSSAMNVTARDAAHAAISGATSDSFVQPAGGPPPKPYDPPVATDNEVAKLKAVLSPDEVKAYQASADKHGTSLDHEIAASLTVDKVLGKPSYVAPDGSRAHVPDTPDVVKSPAGTAPNFGSPGPATPDEISKYRAVLSDGQERTLAAQAIKQKVSPDDIVAGIINKTKSSGGGLPFDEQGRFVEHPVAGTPGAARSSQVIANNFSGSDADVLRQAAAKVGTSPQDLAMVISYESGFKPGIWGGKGGNYLGLIQFGPAEQAKYGVKEGQSFSDQMGAVVAFLKDRGFKPGMGLKDLYSTINAGSPGHYNASDGNGTVAGHVEAMQAMHGDRVAKFLGNNVVTGGAPSLGSVTEGQLGALQENARKIAANNFPNDPEAATIAGDQAVSRVQSMYHQALSAQNDAARASFEELNKATNPPEGRGPTNLDELFKGDPALKNKYDNASPEFRQKIDADLRGNAMNKNVPLSQEGIDRMNKYRWMAMTDPDGYKKLSIISDDKLTQQQKTEAIHWQEKPPAAPQTAHDIMGQLAPQLHALKIDQRSNPEKYNALAGALAAQVQIDETKKGGPLNPTEKQELGTKMLRGQVVQTGFMWNSQSPIFTAVPSSEERQQIIDAYHKTWGKDPKPDIINQIYRNAKIHDPSVKAAD